MIYIEMLNYINTLKCSWIVSSSSIRISFEFRSVASNLPRIWASQTPSILKMQLLTLQSESWTSNHRFICIQNLPCHGLRKAFQDSFDIYTLSLETNIFKLWQFMPRPPSGIAWLSRSARFKAWISTKETSFIQIEGQTRAFYLLLPNDGWAGLGLVGQCVAGAGPAALLWAGLGWAGRDGTEHVGRG